jgi:hypothetical protein
MCKTRIEDVGLVIDIGSKSGRLRIVFFLGGGGVRCRCVFKVFRNCVKVT